MNTMIFGRFSAPQTRKFILSRQEAGSQRGINIYPLTHHYSTQLKSWTHKVRKTSRFCPTHRCGIWSWLVEESTYILNSKTQTIFYTLLEQEDHCQIQHYIFASKRMKPFQIPQLSFSFSHTSEHEFCVLHCFEGKEIQNTYLILCKYKTVNAYATLKISCIGSGRKNVLAGTKCQTTVVAIGDKSILCPWEPSLLSTESPFPTWSSLTHFHRCFTASLCILAISYS